MKVKVFNNRKSSSTFTVLADIPPAILNSFIISKLDIRSTNQ